MGFTDDCYTDGRDPSVTPSVLLLPTEFIDVTDGISPSAKLYNVVVNHQGQHSFNGDLRDAKFAWNKLCFEPTFEKLKLALFSGK
jgi:hypothetical protein